MYFYLNDVFSDQIEKYLKMIIDALWKLHLSHIEVDKINN